MGIAPETLPDYPNIQLTSMTVYQPDPTPDGYEVGATLTDTSDPQILIGKAARPFQPNV
jgi:hypothetical protein